MTKHEKTKEIYENSLKVIKGNYSSVAKASSAIIATDSIMNLCNWTNKAVCKKGCSYCCHHPVAITPQEAALIGNYTGKPPKKPRHHTYATESKDPCPFLKDNECSVYVVRPIVCRTFQSLDSVEYCKQSDTVHKITTIASNDAIMNICKELMIDCNYKNADIREFFR